jgi:hypothetical protein
LKRRDLGGKGDEAVVFMAPKDLFKSYNRLRIKRDNRFEKISEQKIIYSETGGHVLTPFLEKQVKNDKEKLPIKNRVQSAD